MTKWDGYEGDDEDNFEYYAEDDEGWDDKVNDYDEVEHDDNDDDEMDDDGDEMEWKTKGIMKMIHDEVGNGDNVMNGEDDD